MVHTSATDVPIGDRICTPPPHRAELDAQMGGQVIYPSGNSTTSPATPQSRGCVDVDKQES